MQILADTLQIDQKMKYMQFFLILSIYISKVLVILNINTFAYLQIVKNQVLEKMRLNI